MTAADPIPASSECELTLDLLSRHESAAAISGILRDAQEIRRVLSLYSFRTTESAERLCAELSSRYRRDVLSLYGSASLPRRQSENCYLRLEQLLRELLRVAMLRLCRTGALPFSQTQLLNSDGMLLALLSAQG